MLNREIKFRAWTEMESDDGSKHMAMLDHDNLLPWSLEDLVDPENGKNVLMQYTGIKDRNGTEIYEGDIVGSFVDADNEVYGVLVVAWREGSGMWDVMEHITGGDGADDYEDDWSEDVVGIISEDTEVVGNIYESNA